MRVDEESTGEMKWQNMLTYTMNQESPQCFCATSLSECKYNDNARQNVESYKIKTFLQESLTPTPSEPECQHRGSQHSEPV